MIDFSCGRSAPDAISPKNKLLVPTMTCLTVLALFACILLIGRLPTSWHLRMTIACTTPQDQISGAVLTKISTAFKMACSRCRK